MKLKIIFSVTFFEDVKGHFQEESQSPSKIQGQNNKLNTQRF